MIYLVSAEPPSLGGVQSIVIEVSSAKELVGTAGASGITAAITTRALDAGERPSVFAATTFHW